MRLHMSVGAGVVALDDQSVSLKLSVASAKASTGTFVKQPQHTKTVQRQPQDPLLQDWNTQRQKQYFLLLCNTLILQPQTLSGFLRLSVTRDYFQSLPITLEQTLTLINSVWD